MYIYICIYIHVHACHPIVWNIFLHMLCSHVFLQVCKCARVRAHTYPFTNPFFLTQTRTYTLTHTHTLSHLKVRPCIIDRQTPTARLILRSLLRGQTLRGLTLQNNPAKNPATLDEHRKDGQRSILLSKEIWPQGCGRPNGSRSARLRHLTSHSPVAKSPYCAELTFVYLCGVPPVLQGSLRGSFAGHSSQCLTPQRTPQNNASRQKQTRLYIPATFL